MREARRAGADDGATLLLLSDGLANVGVADPDQLEAIAEGALRSGRVATTTLGLGLGYDEVLLSAIARGGAGSSHFAEEPDRAAALIAGEIDGLLAQAVQAASLTITPTGDVASVTVWNDLPCTGITDGVMVVLCRWAVSPFHWSTSSCRAGPRARVGQARRSSRQRRVRCSPEQAAAVTLQRGCVALERACAAMHTRRGGALGLPHAEYGRNTVGHPVASSLRDLGAAAKVGH